jgi:putative two-component system response regulator
MTAIMERSVAADRDLVLAVDDNEHNLQLLEEYLGTWGYDVVFARDGAQALQLYPRVNPSIIVLDVMMPVMDGYDACARIKEQPGGRTIPILMLTALTGTEEKIRALQCGADDFLNKPINKDELRTRIRSLIKIGNLRKELDSSENIILTLNYALENKDPRSGGHVQRVALYAARLCDHLGMTADEKETVVKGALLHDVGMIGIPDELVTKRPLTDDERARRAAHTQLGASILAPMKSFRRFVPIVRWHHERLDGRGFPDGLRGHEIPLEAQIVGLSDRFDEIRHDDHLGEDDALLRVRHETDGGAFDRDLVEVFAASLREDSLGIPASRHIQIRELPAPHVLCADDDDRNREMVAGILQREGFQVSQVRDGAEAREVITRDGIDVVLLDLIMPGQHGSETLRELRADKRHEFLPIIALTSERGATMRQEAIVAGADDFISYPVNRLELVTRIRSLLRIKDYHADLEQEQNVICALALALEAKDRYTRGHSQRVGDLARSFALHLGCDEATADRMRIAGLLHDIGKIAVPEALLNKQGPLTKEEFLRVIDHPVIGEEMVRPLMTLAGVQRMIRHHHERYDGRGYPDGLRGDSIPFEVRLLSIVDAYDALTSHRSYRPSALTHNAAIETLRREGNAGKWDPQLVAEFVRMLGAQPPDWQRIAVPVPSLFANGTG